MDLAGLQSHWAYYLACLLSHIGPTVPWQTWNIHPYFRVCNRNVKLQRTRRILPDLGHVGLSDPFATVWGPSEGPMVNICPAVDLCQHCPFPSFFFHSIALGGRNWKGFLHLSSFMPACWFNFRHWQPDFILTMMIWYIVLFVCDLSLTRVWMFTMYTVWHSVICTRHFVKHIWNVPLAVGLILQLLCSPIGNRNFQEKTNHHDRADATQCTSNYK